MASTEEAIGTGQRDAPGAGQPPPVDALHADVGVRRPRDADHRPRRGLLRLGRARQALPRRALALFCVNIGHGRADVAQAGADQAKELGFFTNWSYAHPPAIELAAADRVARARRPQPGVLHQRRQRGGRVGAQARAPVPQAHRQARTRPRSSRARSPTTAPPWAPCRRPGITEPARAVRAAHPGGCHVPNTNIYRLPRGRHRRPGRRGDRRADRVRGPGHGRRGDPRAGAERRRLLHAAGRLLPARARDLRRVRRAADLRRGDLRLGPARRMVRLASATTTCPTSSRPPRG